MIIGKDTNIDFNKNNSFINNGEKDPIQTGNIDTDMLREKNRVMQHTDVTSKNEMNDKAFAMLQDRLNKGLISMEDFNKMCNQLGKRK